MSTDITAADIAEFLTSNDNDFADNLYGWASLSAEGNVVHIKVELLKETPWGGEADKENTAHFHAVVLRADQPKRVVLCGSTRFSKAFAEANLTETLAGRIVLSIGCDTRSDHEVFAGKSPEDLARIKAELDELHKWKIDLANEVLVLNVGGYVGDSTRSEIEYAVKLGKPVRYLEAASGEVEHRAALLKVHTYDELIFGGFICTHCTVDDDFDPTPWPCPSLHAVGVTNEEAVAIITAHRAEIARKAALEAGAL